MKQGLLYLKINISEETTKDRKNCKEGSERGKPNGNFMCSAGDSNKFKELYSEKRRHDSCQDIVKKSKTVDIDTQILHKLWPSTHTQF